jgi:tetratricopeptide (TPR) repeat protein
MRNEMLERFYSVLMLDEIEEYEETIEALSDHLASHPWDPVAYHNRGVAYLEIGENDRALADLGEAVRLSRGGGQPAMTRGRLRESLGDLARALDDYDLGVGLEPDDPYFRRIRASARLAAGDLTGAVKDLDRAIELQPGFGVTYEQRAAILERLGAINFALQDREMASRLLGLGKS